MSAPTSILPFPPLPPSYLSTQLPVYPATQPPNHPSSQPTVYLSNSKESAPRELPKPQPESAPLVELRETEPLPAEVEGWLQKLDQEGDIKLDAPITHDGQVLLADTEAQIVKEKIVLPLSQSGVKQGLSRQVADSARWLAEWCVRLIKMMHDKVKYAPETITDHGKT